MLYEKRLYNKTPDSRHQYEKRRNKVKNMPTEAKRVIWDKKCNEIEQYIGGKDAQNP